MIVCVIRRLSVSFYAHACNFTMSQLKISKFVEFGKKIIAFGRNYSEHIAEMGYTKPEQQMPVMFMKPTTAYITEGQPICFPEGCQELHHEVELGVVIGKNISRVSETEANDAIAGYVLALDMTARDFQQISKNNGEPWLLAKGFDTSCPVGNLIEVDKIGDPADLNLWLKVNGLVKQNGNTSQMLYGIPKLISHVTKFVTLEYGDLVLTGTPSGVGPVQPGDTIDAGIGDIFSMQFKVAK